MCFLVSILLLLFVGAAYAVEPPYVTAHVDIYKETDRFAGWPANNGIWNWDNEIVVGFILGYHKDQEGHTIARDRPSPRMQARSLDGGLTWTIEETTFADSDAKARPTSDLPAPIDFSHPDFAARLAGNQFFYSLDRCRTW